MKTTTLYPSLTDDEWVDNADIAKRLIFNSFLNSDFSQSSMYQVSSLKYILHNNSGDINKIVNAISNGLNDIYSSYFEIVNPNVEVRLIEEATNNVTIYISIELSNSLGERTSLTGDILVNTNNNRLLSNTITG